jgi:hypothetical protein
MVVCSETGALCSDRQQQRGGFSGFMGLYSKVLWLTLTGSARYPLKHITLCFFPRHISLIGPVILVAPRSQIARMTEDTGAPPSNPAKQPCDEDTAQASPKRVRVDTQTPIDMNALNPGSDVLPGNKKPAKRRDAYPKSRHGKEKVNKNLGRRRRSNRPEAPQDERTRTTTETVPQDLSEKSPRLPKRQSAILLGFCGTGCAGMQMLVFFALYRFSVTTPPILTKCPSVASRMPVRSKECYSMRSCVSARCRQIMRTTPRKLTSHARLVRTQGYTQREISYP